MYFIVSHFVVRFHGIAFKKNLFIIIWYFNCLQTCKEDDAY